MKSPEAIARDRARSAALALVGVLLLALFVVHVPAQEPPSEPTESTWQTHRHGGQVAIFEDARVARGEVRSGDVVCVFGDVDIEGEVTGDLVIIGGTLHISGSVGHDVVAILSTVTIDEGARIGNNLVNVMGSMDNRGTVEEDTVNVPVFFQPMRLRTPFGTIGSIIAWFALLLAVFMFFVLLLIAAVAPDRVRILADEVPVSYLFALLVGISGYVAVFVAHALLWITIIGIPLSGLLHIAFLVAKWLGVAGICQYVGRSIGRVFGRELSPLAAILVGMLPFWALHLVPMFLGGIGFLFALGFRCLYWVLVEIPAVGLVILTRGGSRPRRTPWPAPQPVTIPEAAPPTPP